MPFPTGRCCESVAEHGERRDMGLPEPWWRGWHGLLAAWGMVIVADGIEAAARRLARVLWNDPASGVMRHAYPSYDFALDCAR